MLKEILAKYRKLFGVALSVEGAQLRLGGSVLDLDDPVADLIRDDATLEVYHLARPMRCALVHIRSIDTGCAMADSHVTSGAPSPILGVLSPSFASPSASVRQKRKEGPDDDAGEAKAEKALSEGKKARGDADVKRSAQPTSMPAAKPAPAALTGAPHTQPQGHRGSAASAPASPATTSTTSPAEAAPAPLDLTRSPSKRKTPPAPPAPRTVSDDEAALPPPAVTPGKAKVRTPSTPPERFAIARTRSVVIYIDHTHKHT